MIAKSLENKWLWLALLVIGVVAAYFPSLSADLIFDDQRLVDGTIFAEYGSVLDIKPRILSYGSFVWLAFLAGDAWPVQHAANIGLHLATALALSLCRSVMDAIAWDAPPGADAAGEARAKDAAAALGVALFAFNPVAVYAVAYLVQRSILMATLFSVLALCLVARAARSGGHWPLAAAVLSYGAAVLSKEHAVMLPLVALALFAIIARPTRRVILSWAGVTLAVLGLGLAGMALRYGPLIARPIDASSHAYVLQLTALNPAFADQLFLLNAFNQAWLYFRYGLIWALPYPGWMSVDLRPPFPLLPTDLPQVLGPPLFIAALAAAVWLMWRFSDWRRLAGLGLFAPGVLFLTEFAIVWIQDPFVLYRSYLWGLGMPLLLASLATGARARPVLIVAAALACLLGAFVFERVLSLHTEAAAWADAAEKIDRAAPQNAVGRWRPFMNRGNGYFRRDMMSAALADYEAAAGLGDPAGLAEYHRGLALERLGRKDEALIAYGRAARSTSTPPEFAGLASFELGKLLFEREQFVAAAAELERALGAMRDDESRLVALKVRAQCNVKSDRPAEAVADYRKAVELDPKDRVTRVGLALALNGAGKAEEANDVLATLLREADAWDVRLGRAMLFDAQGRTDRAREEMRLALRMNPSERVLLGYARKLGVAP